MEHELSIVAELTDRALVGSDTKYPVRSRLGKEPQSEKEPECDSLVPVNPAARISDSVILNDCHTGLTQEMEDLV